MSEDFPGLAGFRAGSLLAGYRLEAQVGAGGMAVVFRARDQRLGRLVALKILAPGLTADPGFRRRFIAESRAATAVDDPHIIPVYEAGEAGGVMFIAMRFVLGGDLRRVLDREGVLVPGRAAEFLSPVASALDAAHGAGLVHRDVKPANILVDARPDRPDHVYLSDFGVSKGAVTSVSLAGGGQFLGTPDYSAPEQIQGRAVDGRTDQYALACVAYQMLVGAVPYERDQGMAVLLAHLSEPPPSLGSRRPGLPDAADRVLARGMAKIPEERYGSCREFADALREALGVEPYHPRDPVSDGIRGPASAPGHPHTQVGSPSAGFPAPAAASLAADAASTVTKAPPWLASSAVGQTRAGPGAGPAAPAGDGKQRLAAPPRDGHPRPRRPRLVGRAIRRRPAIIVTVAIGIAVIGLVIAITVIPGARGTPGALATSGVHDTPTAHGSPSADGTPGQVRWTYTYGGSISPGLAVAGGTVYFVSGDGAVHALDATGQARWNNTTYGGSIGSGPAVAGGTVYIVSGAGKVYALGAATGRVRWTYTTGGKFPGLAVAVAGSTVYVGSGDKVYALGAGTGQAAWTYATIGSYVVDGLAVAGGTAYVVSADGTVYALDAATGQVRWTNTTTTIYTAGPPAVAGGTIYISSVPGAVYALDAATGQVRWTYATGTGQDDSFQSGPAVAGGTVYIGNENHKVYALDAATGRVRWTYATGNAVTASPAVAGGTVYIGSNDGKLYALDAATGRVRWTYTGGNYVDSTPAVAGGTVYLIGSDDSKLYALSAGG